MASLCNLGLSITVHGIINAPHQQLHYTAGWREEDREARSGALEGAEGKGGEVVAHPENKRKRNREGKREEGRKLKEWTPWNQERGRLA